MSKNLKVHLALLSVALIYGANYSIAKKLMPEYMLPFGVILMRALGAGFLFWILSFTQKREKIERKRDYLSFFICAAFGVAANQLMFFKGLTLTTPINAALIMTTTPILVFVVSVFMLGERITWLKVIGILLGVSGAVGLIGLKGFDFEGGTALGDLFIFLNASSYAAYLVMVKPLMKKYEALTVTRWVFTFGLLLVIPFGFQELSETKWSAMPPEAFAYLGFIILFTTFFAYLLNAWALRFVNAVIVGFYIYLQPVFAALIAVSIGMDSLDLSTMLCSLLIFAGVYLVSIRKSRSIKEEKSFEK